MKTNGRTEEVNMKVVEKIVAEVVAKKGGCREKEIFNNPHTMMRTDDWNNEHKVVEVVSNGCSFEVDVVTLKICG